MNIVGIKSTEPGMVVYLAKHKLPISYTQKYSAIHKLQKQLENGIIHDSKKINLIKKDIRFLKSYRPTVGTSRARRARRANAKAKKLKLRSPKKVLKA